MKNLEKGRVEKAERFESRKSKGRKGDESRRNSGTKNI